MVTGRPRLSRPILWTAALLAAALAVTLPAPTAAHPRTGAGRKGMVSASTPYAASAGAHVLGAGGNAVDAAVATLFALMVTDPPMTSLGGRCQILIVLADGRATGIDGSTAAPLLLPPLGGPGDDRQGYAAAPIPGSPAALAEAHRRFGKLPWKELLAPAISLARDGYRVTPRIAAIWAETADRLSRDSGAARNFLQPDGSPFREGELFRQPRLARVLQAVAESGVDAFYKGTLGAAIADDMLASGGFVRARDLRAHRPLAAPVRRARYRDYEVLSLGGHAWGDTLMEMVRILQHFAIGRAGSRERDLEILARLIAQALEDRPQELGTLKPKRGGLALAQLADASFAAQRAEAIERNLGQPVSEARAAPPDRGETTHLSVMDAAGNAVSLTTSIGPRFGARVAHPELGFLYGHSYRMRSDPTPGARDETEMSPTIVLRNGRPVLALGAAGSERIPGAILQVLSQVADYGRSLEEAVAAPRLFCAGVQLRLDERLPAGFAESMTRLGFRVERVRHEISRHLGIVHAVSYDPETAMFFGVADQAYDGAAAGPP